VATLPQGRRFPGSRARLASRERYTQIDVMVMKRGLRMSVALATVFVVPGWAQEHPHHEGTGTTLGRVVFPISCNPAAQSGFEHAPNARRRQAYADTLARLHRDVPDDPEVAIHYALSLVATASPADTTFARQKQAAAILNPLFRRFPEHPGLAHYIIHANDSPQ